MVTINKELKDKYGLPTLLFDTEFKENDYKMRVDMAADAKEMLEAAGVSANVKSAGDLFTLHQWIKNEPVDLLIGNTYGKFIAKAEDIPFVRLGFPILDRSVHSYLPVVGYHGAMRLIEMISGALLDRQDRDAADEDFELVM